MTHLACRFCVDAEAVHVVDPLLDLRHRFEDLQGLDKMLKDRGCQIDVNNVAMNYHIWWKSYTKWRDSWFETRGVMSRDRELRQRMLEKNGGLLDALRLPNDLSVHTPIGGDAVSDEFDNEQKKQHMLLLLKAGMVKVDPVTSYAHLVGFPANLQHLLQKLLRGKLGENILNISPPYFVRGAVIDGVNISKEQYPQFKPSQHNESVLYLTGHSISSLIALFVKKSFGLKTNKWPLRILSSGASYLVPKNMLVSELDLNNISQRMKTVALSFCKTEEEESAEHTYFVAKLEAVLKNQLSLKIASSSVHAHRLLNFESFATCFRSSSGIEIARVSSVGSYISRRLCILCDSDLGGADFVRMVFVDIDLTRLLVSVIEEHLISKKAVPEDVFQLFKV
ncbi:unnamed protein product [Thelazia callipaeda]|uniref:DUF676 domain-containing protein n=1 Tax=Thelazia callipaeda TaxID=103827 RepID=A0A0N5CMN3_THECL|nr:unnamed protein product [Thelazia callipaeda]